MWLLWLNIKSNRSCYKFGFTQIGPFRIQEQINLVAYRLELPTSMKVHSVFHVFLLKVYKGSTISVELQSLPLAVEVENHDEYKVEVVLVSRRRRESYNILTIGRDMTSVNERGG